MFARGAKREHARTGTQNSAPKLLFIEDFCRDFCARQEVRGFCDGNLQNVNDQILRPQTLSRRFLQRFLRVARNASTHERSAQNSAPKFLFIEDFCRDFCARQEVCGFCDGNLQNVNNQAKTQARRGIAQKDRKNHSHSMVAGGFEVISYTTRFACFTSFTIRVEIFSRTS